MKPNAIIVDDIPADIAIVKNIIKQTGYIDCFNFYECNYVKIIPKGKTGKTLVELINDIKNKKQIIDFAFLDILFEDEYLGQAIEAGCKAAFHIVKESFPNCQILLSSKNAGQEKDSNFKEYTGGVYFNKNLLSTDTAKDRLTKTINNWLRLKCLDISNNHTEKTKLMNSIQKNNVEWNTEVTILGNKWTIEELFFIYKSNTINELQQFILSQLVIFPTIKPNKEDNRWDEAGGIYGSPLKDYYYCLYLHHFGEIQNIENEVKEVLTPTFELLIQYLQNNQDIKLENMKENLFRIASTICNNIDTSVRAIDENPYNAFYDFKKKLLARLFFLSGYLLLKLPAYSLFYICSKKDYLSNNNIKSIGNALFIFDMKYTEEIGIFEKFICKNFSKHDNVKKLEKFHPTNRNYSKVLKCCSDYELRFLSDYFHLIQNKITAEDNPSINEYFTENIRTLENEKLLNISHNPK